MNKLEFLEERITEISERILMLQKDTMEFRQLENLSPLFDSGDSAWMMYSTIVVFAMTLPGVGLFYGGLVPTNMSFIAAGLQTLSIVVIVTFLWLCFSYSLCFGPRDLQTGHLLIGDFSKSWFMKSSIDSSYSLAHSIPESIFFIYQLAFAIITVALIPGSFTDRMKFSSFLIFVSLWHIIVYCPIAHANWHPSGLLFKAGAIDFAGGNVVHISSGVSALVATLIVGKGFGKNEMKPHNVIVSLMGGGLIWGGWFGFNAGSALSANSSAGTALLNTQISASCAGLTFLITDNLYARKHSAISLMCGIISGLVAITPAAGYVDTTAAFVIGLVVGPLCYFGCLIKKNFGIDDSLDAFGIHGIGGIVGGLGTGLFAKAEIGGVNGVFYGNSRQLLYQMYGILFTIGWSIVGTFLIMYFMKYTVGVRIRMVYNRLGRAHRNPLGADRPSVNLWSPAKVLTISRISRMASRTGGGMTPSASKQNLRGSTGSNGHLSQLDGGDAQYDSNTISYNDSPKKPSLRPYESPKRSYRLGKTSPKRFTTIHLDKMDRSVHMAQPLKERSESCISSADEKMGNDVLHDERIHEAIEMCRTPQTQRKISLHMETMNP